MIYALDIETIPNLEAVALMPEPEVKLGNLKDPAKIAEKIADAKRSMAEDAALDALTGRVLCFAAVGDEGETGAMIDAATDEAERAVIQQLMEMFADETARLVTWNGIGFDIPFIYGRALILDVRPAAFGAPPRDTWMKRHNTDKHFDLMQLWSGWKPGTYAKLDTVAGIVLGAHKTEGIDVTTFNVVMQTEEGRTKIAEYCMQDTRLTWELWKRMNGVLFA